MFLLIENGEVYGPEPRGRQSVLVVDARIVKVNAVDRRAVEAIAPECEVIDATGCVVTPGLIDPHQHLLGGSGEGSLALQTPMLFPREIVRAGITTVVGTLGVDTTMKTIEGLLGRVKALTEEGVDAFMWTGGYNVPPVTMLNSVREDMMYIDAVIGAGEVAISDERSIDHDAEELNKLVRDTHIGGLLTGKAGITHLHVGEEPSRLAILREIITDYHVRPEWLYPTHVERNAQLMDEALELAGAGAYVDIDTVNGDLIRWFRHYLDRGGPLDRLTFSSDADSGTPDIHWRQICALVVKYRYPLEMILPLVTSNTARVLKLRGKGHVAPGCFADLLVLDAGTLDIRYVIARGKIVVREGEVVLREQWLQTSKRNIALVGEQFDGFA